jgi:hypothetical protein
VAPARRRRHRRSHRRHVLTLIYTPAMACIFAGNGFKVTRRAWRQKLELDAY